MASSRPSQPQEPQGKPQKRSLWDIFEEFRESMSPELKASLPKDGAEQHDHYIYGWPKREQ